MCTCDQRFIEETVILIVRCHPTCVAFTVLPVREYMMHRIMEAACFLVAFSARTNQSSSLQGWFSLFFDARKVARTPHSRVEKTSIKKGVGFAALLRA